MKIIIIYNRKEQIIAKQNRNDEKRVDLKSRIEFSRIAEEYNHN